jgi:hypothetical protein
VTERDNQSESLAEIAARGDRRATLEVLRDRLAADIDRAREPADVATLTRQLGIVLKDIEALSANDTKGDSVDEIAARREERRAEATVPDRPAAGEQRGPGSGGTRGQRRTRT